MADIYNRDITITLTGAEWFAVAVALHHAKAPKNQFSKEGETKLKLARRVIERALLGATKE